MICLVSTKETLLIFVPQKRIALVVISNILNNVRLDRKRQGICMLRGTQKGHAN